METTQPGTSKDIHHTTHNTIPSRATSVSRKRTATPTDNSTTNNSNDEVGTLQSRTTNHTQTSTMRHTSEGTNIDEPLPKRSKPTPRDRIMAAAREADSTTGTIGSSSSLRRIDSDGDIEMADAEDAHSLLRVQSRTISAARFVNSTSLSSLSSDVGSTVFQYLDIHSCIALSQTQQFWHQIANLRASYYVPSLPKFGSEFSVPEYRQWRKDCKIIILNPAELIVASKSPAMKFVQNLEIELDILPLHKVAPSYDLVTFQAALQQFRSLRFLCVRIVQGSPPQYGPDKTPAADRAVTTATIAALFGTWSSQLLVLDVDAREGLFGSGFHTVLEPIAANMEMLTELRIFQCFSLCDGNRDPFGLHLRFYRSDVVAIQILTGWIWFQFTYQPPPQSKGYPAANTFVDPCDSRIVPEVYTHRTTRTGIISFYPLHLNPDEEDIEDYPHAAQAVHHVNVGLARMMEREDKHFQQIGITVREGLKNPDTGESISLAPLCHIASSIRSVSHCMPMDEGGEDGVQLNLSLDHVEEMLRQLGLWHGRPREYPEAYTLVEELELASTWKEAPTISPAWSKVFEVFPKLRSLRLYSCLLLPHYPEIIPFRQLVELELTFLLEGTPRIPTLMTVAIHLPHLASLHLNLGGSWWHSREDFTDALLPFILSSNSLCHISFDVPHHSIETRPDLPWSKKADHIIFYSWHCIIQAMRPSHQIPPLDYDTRSDPIDLLLPFLLESQKRAVDWSSARSSSVSRVWNGVSSAISDRLPQWIRNAAGKVNPIELARRKKIQQIQESYAKEREEINGKIEELLRNENRERVEPRPLELQLYHGRLAYSRV